MYLSRVQRFSTCTLHDSIHIRSDFCWEIWRVVCILSTCPFGSESTRRLRRDKWAGFWIPFLSQNNYSACISLSSCCRLVISEYFKEFQKSAHSIPQQKCSSALTAKIQVLRMHTTLQISQQKLESIQRLYHTRFLHARKCKFVPILFRVLTSIDYWKAWFSGKIISGPSAIYWLNSANGWISTYLQNS